MPFLSITYFLHQTSLLLSSPEESNTVVANQHPARDNCRKYIESDSKNTKAAHFSFPNGVPAGESAPKYRPLEIGALLSKFFSLLVCASCTWGIRERERERAFASSSRVRKRKKRSGNVESVQRSKLVSSSTSFF